MIFPCITGPLIERSETLTVNSPEDKSYGSFPSTVSDFLKLNCWIVGNTVGNLKVLLGTTSTTLTSPCVAVGVTAQRKLYRSYKHKFLPAAAR